MFDIIGDSDARENYSASRNAYANPAIGQVQVRAKLLVGADGIRSNVRKIMGGETTHVSFRIICSIRFPLLFSLCFLNNSLWIQPIAWLHLYSAIVRFEESCPRKFHDESLGMLR